MLSEELRDELSEEPLAREADAAETVACERPVCDRTVFEGATVDVAVGAVVGQWTDPEPHVGVTGVESDEPELETWCLSCATERFDVERSAHEKRMERASHYITASNLAAFCLGVTVVALFVLLV